MPSCWPGKIQIEVFNHWQSFSTKHASGSAIFAVNTKFKLFSCNVLSIVWIDEVVIETTIDITVLNGTVYFFQFGEPFTTYSKPQK